MIHTDTYSMYECVRVRIGTRDLMYETLRMKVAAGSQERYLTVRYLS